MFVGDVPLEAGQAWHAREALRLSEGAVVEVFDDGGAVASGELVFDGGRGVAVRVGRVEEAGAGSVRIVVAAAVPKGERADWMVEKLSELGVSRFVPLAAERSVVLPEGKGKHDRWVRIAIESAKQCRRAGVMGIEALTKVDALLADCRGALVLSTAPEAVGFTDAIATAGAEPIVLVIGPEGGWTARELSAFDAAGARQVRLTHTVLRIETAAVAAAAVAAVMRG